MAETMRFGVVGCGAIGPTHMGAIQQIADAELVAIADTNREKAEAAAQKHNVGTIYDSLDALLADPNIDAVCICTPSGMHADGAVKAMRAGKHVVVEKPMDVSLEACDRMIAAEDETGKTLAIISQHRFDAATVLVKEAIDSGKLGKIVLADATVKWWRTQNYYDSGEWRGTWAMDGGGALMNQGVHYVDQLRWIMGPVKSVAATMSTRAHERIEVEDTISATIEFESGATGTLLASTALFPGYRQALEVYGTGGTVIVENSKVKHAQFQTGDEQRSPGGVKANPPEVKDFVATTETVAEGDESKGMAAADPRAISTSGHVAQFQDLIGAIRENRDTFMNGAEARAALELIVGVYRAAKTGERVQFPIVD